ncbi:hypothetical protein VB779_08265 [Haloarculaceae archaeon H-GB11]|nr:hypothetical protein [Haloarculaceae archaeon H-GB11]
MDWVRGVEYGVVAVLLGVALVSGPLVGAVDLTHEPPADYGEGTVTVGAVSAPDSATLDRGSYGEQSYQLEVPDATLEVTAISGRPIVAYTLSIDVLGYSRTTTHFFSERNNGTQTLSLESDTFAPDEIGNSSYDGELEIVVRDSGPERTVLRTNVTVEVEG